MNKISFLFLFFSIFSSSIYSQIDSTIVEIKTTKTMFLFGFNEKDDKIYNSILKKIDSLEKLDERIREEIDNISSSVKYNLIYDYASNFDRNYTKKLSYISKYIKTKGIVPIPTLDPKPWDRICAIKDPNLFNQVSIAFYNSNQLEDCNFFKLDTTLINRLAFTSKDESAEVIRKYKYLKWYKKNNNLSKVDSEKLDCHIANLKLILEEMKRMKYITDY